MMYEITYTDDGNGGGVVWIEADRIEDARAALMGQARMEGVVRVIEEEIEYV